MQCGLMQAHNKANSADPIPRRFATLHSAVSGRLICNVMSQKMERIDNVEYQ